MKLKQQDIEVVCGHLCSYADVDVMPSLDTDEVRFRLSYHAPGLIDRAIVVDGVISGRALMLGDRQAIVKRIDDAARRLDFLVLRSGVLQGAAKLATLARRAIDWSNMSDAAKAVLESGWEPVEEAELERKAGGA